MEVLLNAQLVTLVSLNQETTVLLKTVLSSTAKPVHKTLLLFVYLVKATLF